MEVSSSHQIYVFFICVLSGIGCGMFFDIQRFIRRLCTAGMARTQFEDIIFAVMCVCAMLGLSFCFNNGEIRYYEVMGSISGALLYAAVMSRIFMKILELFVKIVTRLIIIPVIKICSFLIKPLKRFSEFLRKMLRKLKKFISAIGRNVKKREKRLKKRIKML